MKAQQILIRRRLSLKLPPSRYVHKVLCCFRRLLGGGGAAGPLAVAEGREGPHQAARIAQGCLERRRSPEEPGGGPAIVPRPMLGAPPRRHSLSRGSFRGAARLDPAGEGAGARAASGSGCRCQAAGDTRGLGTSGHTGRVGGGYPCNTQADGELVVYPYT